MSFFGVGNPFSTPVGQKIGTLEVIFLRIVEDSVELFDNPVIKVLFLRCALENLQFSLCFACKLLFIFVQGLIDIVQLGFNNFFLWSVALCELYE